MYLMPCKGGMLTFSTTRGPLDSATRASRPTIAETRRWRHPAGGDAGFSSFGSVRDPRSTMVADATALLRRRRPDLEVEGEMRPTSRSTTR